MNIWQVGDVTITRVIEMEITGGTRFILPQATPSAIEDMEWMVPHFATAEGKLIMSVHALVVDTPSQRIICLLYTSPSPRDLSTSRMPSSA